MTDKRLSMLEETFSSDLCYLMAMSHIVLANNQVTSRFIEKNYDMPVNAWSTLYAVSYFPGILAKDVQLLFPRPQNSISRAIKLLEDRCLIKREVDNNDTRAKQLFPTAEGAALLSEIENKVVRRQEEVFGALTDLERKTFLSLCRKIIDSGALNSSSALDVF
ncbi:MULTISPECIES: MarR family winged helix-turn-helix transcriptional regulator [Halomonadaceae]|uniref:MarR family winged helix-turn-helix transcriptional regulator n=1 Tax=Halomonadaceae TaxID=28256 RepID=UPI000C329B2F|nr:MarR family winged helix-turn-helix transcriptional regulator [Halomonas sp. MES3-P3E]PKG48592.1 MarR family transcriptional regulator [Halomonas sp. MES3-P3E]